MQLRSQLRHHSSQFLRLITLFILTALLVACSAYAQDAYCPQSISVKQTAEKVPAGWTAGQEKTPNNLAGITLL